MVCFESCREVATKYPGIKYNEIIVDNCCMQLVSKPEQFDVMVPRVVDGDDNLVPKKKFIGFGMSDFEKESITTVGLQKKCGKRFPLDLIHSYIQFPEQYDESTSQERIESKIQNAPAGQGSVRMLSREEWENIQEVRPRTPFESKLARPNARVRTGEPLHMDDVKDWTIDVLTDALTRVEESVRRSNAK